MTEKEKDLEVAAEATVEQETQPAAVAESPSEEVSAQQEHPDNAVGLTVLDGSGGPSAVHGAVKKAQFGPLGSGVASAGCGSIDLLLDVQLDLAVELGQARMPVREVLQLGPGSVVELNKLAGEPVDILANGKLIARGEVVVIDESFGVRVTEIASQSERLSKLA